MQRKIIALLLVIPVLLFGTVAYAAVAVTDEAVLGNDRWSVNSSGNIVPGADSTYDIGASGNVVEDIFVEGITLGGVEKTSWGSVVTPWEEVGTALYPTSAPYKFRLNTSTGMFSATGLTVDSGNLNFGENGAIIENGTNAEIQFTEGGDNLTMVFDGTNVELEIDNDGGHFIIDVNETDASDASVQFRTSNDDDDYIRIWTSGNEPILESWGDCDLNIRATSGFIDFDNDTIMVSGTASLSTVTVNSTITLLNQDTIVNSVDDTFEFKSNDLTTTVRVEGYEGYDAILELASDDGDTTADVWQLMADNGTKDLVLYSTSGGITVASVTTAGALEYKGDISIWGTTPKLTIGDGDAEDTIIVFDTADADFYIGYDDTAANQCLFIGTGATVASNPIMKIATQGNVTLGRGAVDTDLKIAFDGGDVEWYMALDDDNATDDVNDALIFGTGETVGVGQAVKFATPGNVTLGKGALDVDAGKIVFAGGLVDWYIAFDDTNATDGINDSIVIGTGSTVGLSQMIKIATPGTIILGTGKLVDTSIVFDGYSTDWRISLDDSDGNDELIIGTGRTVGLGDMIIISTLPTVTLGSGKQVDTSIVFDGNVMDWNIGYDDSADELCIGTGTTVGLGQPIRIATDNDVTFERNVYVKGIFIATKESVIGFNPNDFLIVGDANNKIASPVDRASVPNFALANKLPAIVWTNAEVTPVSVTFRVPSDYLSGGAFRAIMDHSVATSHKVDFQVWTNDQGTAWDSSATNQTPATLGSAGSPSTVTLSVTTDFGSIQAASLVTVELWPGLANASIGDLELYYLQFYYNATS